MELCRILFMSAFSLSLELLFRFYYIYMFIVVRYICRSFVRLSAPNIYLFRQSNTSLDEKVALRVLPSYSIWFKYNKCNGNNAL